MPTLTNVIQGKWTQQIDGQVVRQMNFGNSLGMPGYTVSGSFPKGGQTDNYISGFTGTPIDTGSCTTIGYMGYDNLASCSIGVYSDAACSKPITFLQISQSSGPIPWNNTGSFWGKCLNAPFSGSLNAQFSEM